MKVSRICLTSVIILLIQVACVHSIDSDQRDTIRISLFKVANIVQAMVQHRAGGADVSGTELVRLALEQNQTAKRVLENYFMDVRIVSGPNGKSLGVVLLCDSNKDWAIFEAVACKINPVFEEYSSRSMPCDFAMNVKARCN